MTAATQTLADWLLACIAEDEAKAREAMARIAKEGTYALHGGGSELDVYEVRDYWEVGVVIDPARVLAECEAKRRIIEECIEWWGFGENEEHWDVPVLRLLALPYADREGFREEWRP